MSWQNILKASKDKSSLPPEEINRNALKNTKDWADGNSYRPTEVKPLVKRKNELTYFLASYLDDAPTLKELISEWKESQKMLEYKNAPLRLESISKGINILKKYFKNIEPIETNRKTESDEQKTERLVEFFSKLPNPPSASDITTMENNLDILTKFTEKTKLTDKQKDENRVDKVFESIKDRDADINDLDVSDFNAEDLDTLVEYITDYRNRGRMKRLRPNKMKRLKEIINEIESKNKDFVGIGYNTNGAILTLPATFDEKSKSSLSEFKFENEGEVKKVKLPLFITEQQGKDLAGGSLDEELEITPLGQVFKISKYSDTELDVSMYNEIDKTTIGEEVIIKYFDLIINNPKSSKDIKSKRHDFLPYMNPSQKDEADVIFGIGGIGAKGAIASKTTRFSPTLRYFIDSANLSLTSTLTTSKTTVAFDKVLNELVQQKHRGTDLQNLFNKMLGVKESGQPKSRKEDYKSKKTDTQDKTLEERMIPERDDDGKVKTDGDGNIIYRKVDALAQTTGINMEGMSKFLDEVKSKTSLYQELVDLSKKAQVKPSTSTTKVSKEVENFVTEFRKKYEQTKQGIRRKRYLIEAKKEFRELADIKMLNLNDDDLTKLLTTGDISKITSQNTQNTEQVDIFRNSFKEDGKLNNVANLSLSQESLRSINADLSSVFSLLYYLSILYQDDTFTDKMIDYSEDEAEKIEEEEEEERQKREQKRDIDHNKFMSTMKSKYTEYRNKFLEDTKEKIEEVITKPILIGSTAEPAPLEPAHILINEYKVKAIGEKK